jgi:hypothetical protein
MEKRGRNVRKFWLRVAETRKKLEIGSETVQAVCVRKTPDFFHREPNKINTQKQAFICKNNDCYIKTTASIIQSCLQNYQM